MGREDRGLLLGGLLRHPFLQSGQIQQGPVDGGVQLAPLLVPVLGELFDHDVLVVELHHATDAESRGRGSTEQQVPVARPRPGGLGHRFRDGGYRDGVLRADDTAAGQGRAVLPEALPDALGDRSDGFLRVGSVRGDDDLLTAGNREAHDRDDGLGVGGVVAAAQLDVGAILLRESHERGGGAGVESGRVRHHEGVRCGVDGGSRFLGGFLQRFEFDHGGLVDSAADQARDRGDGGEQLGVGDHHLGQQRLGLAADVIKVEVDQQVTGAHPLPLGDVGAETVAPQPDGVQAYVHQNLESLGTAHGYGVTGGLKIHHLPRNRRCQPSLQGIHGEPVPDHFPGEDRIRHVLDWNHDAGQRRPETHPRGRLCTHNGTSFPEGRCHFGFRTCSPVSSAA